MGWFPTTRDNSSNGWRFDIVGLLAVIGEASIEFCVPAITSLQLSYVPRLLPAPQALLKTERPTQLPSKKNVTVCSVAVGVRVEELNYYPNIFHMIDDVADYEFQEWTIEYSEKAPKNMDAVRNTPGARFYLLVPNHDGLVPFPRSTVPTSNKFDY